MLGNLIGLLVHPADIQDRDGAAKVLATVRTLCPWLRHVFADGGYAGDKLRNELVGMGRWTLEIIKRSDKAKGFEILPRRWVVEGTLAWLNRCTTRKGLRSDHFKRYRLGADRSHPLAHPKAGEGQIGIRQF